MSNFAFELTEEQILQNHATLLKNVQLIFESRAPALIRMYNDYEEEIALAPASSREHFHNAFPGGYIDHVLRVLNFSFTVYNAWQNVGIDVSDFTPEELAFVALHHDLGKIGLPGSGYGRYIFNQSEWHRKNQGKIYDTNPDVPFMPIQDMSLFILQKYGIPLSFNETLGIKIHDGLYEEGNKAYYISHDPKSGLRTHLPHIIHQADMMASKFEYDRWAVAAGRVPKKYNG